MGAACAHILTTECSTCGSTKPKCGLSFEIFAPIKWKESFVLANIMKKTEDVYMTLVHSSGEKKLC